MAAKKLELATGVVTSNIIRYIAGLHGRAPTVELIAQLVENSLDAGAKIVTANLIGGKHPSVVVTDDGSGMLPDLLPGDREILDKYLKDLDDPAKEVPEGYDVLKHIHESSLHSLPWMIQYVGLSPHIKENDPFLMGLLGIGTKAFYVWANEAHYLTRPDFKLASDFWPNVNPDGVPTISYEPPTGVDLERRITNNVIEYPSLVVLKDFKGIPMKHGTRVEIKGLKPGVIEKLTPGVVVAYLSRRFARILREKDVQLVVVDNITSASSKTAFGIEIPVKPPIYDIGVILYERTDSIQVWGEYYPVEILVRYIPGKRPKPFQIRRGGNEVCAITDIPEFNITTWEHVTGYADFPSIPGKEDTLWTPDKLRPMPETPAYHHWAKHMERVGEQVDDAISLYEDKLSEDNVQQITSLVTDSVISAMRNLSAFQHLATFQQAQVKKKKAGIKRKRTEFVETRTFASVVNENGRGIPGLILSLLKSGSGEVPTTEVTDVTGKVSFGELAYGRYTLELLKMPRNARLAPGEQRKVVFNINENFPRKHYTFVLITGEPSSVKMKPLKGVRIWAHHLSSPEELYYLGRYKLGMLEINTSTEEFQQAVMDKDEELQLLIHSFYTSSAMTELAFFGPPTEDGELGETRILFRTMIIQLSKLYIKAYSRALMVQRAERRKKTKGGYSV